MDESTIEDVIMVSEINTSIADRQSPSITNEADDSSVIGCVSDNSNMVRCEADDVLNIEIAESITKEHLMEVVQDSQKQLESLTNEIRVKEQQMKRITQQLAETQKQLHDTSVERDNLRDKNITYNAVIRESLDQLKADGINSILTNPDNLQEIQPDEVDDHIFQACSKHVTDDFQIQVPEKTKPPRRTRGPGKKKKSTLTKTVSPGFRFLIPRPNNDVGEFVDVRIAGCSTDGNVTNDKIIKMGVGNILLGGINEPRSSSQFLFDNSGVRAVTVYGVVEGLKEFEAVFAPPYADCHMPECGVAFSTSQDIERHFKSAHDLSTIVSVHGKKPKACDECEKAFLNVADLKLHKKWHHPVVVDEGVRRAAMQNIAALDHFGQPLLPVDGPPPSSSALTIDVISRPVCPIDGLTKPANSVVASSVVPRKYQCYYCERKFSVKDFCEAHIRQNHFKIARPFFCKTCGRSLTSRKAYQTHLEVHDTHRINAHVCDVCGRNFASVTNLRRHFFIHSNERPHLCSVCGLSFTQKGSLDNHMRVHGYRDSLLCTYCCRGYKSQSKLKEHVESKHRDVQQYQCCICDVVVADATSLQQHFQMHKTAGREKPFGCHLCTFSTYFTRDLACHLDAHKRGVSRLEKKRRSGSTTQSIGPFICRFCAKRCIGKDYLDLHEVKHTGVKKYACEECGRKFTMQPLLKRHIESKHIGVRYPCSLCGKEFTEPGNIKRHIAEVHKKHRPYACGICERVFSQKASLRVHLNTAAHRDRLCRLADIQGQITDTDDVCVTEAVMDQLVFTDGMGHMVIQHDVQ